MRKDAYWRFVRGMIRRNRGRLVAALGFAFVSAGGLGVGLVSLGPILRMLLDPEGARSLRTIAESHNAEHPGWRAVPAVVLERLPETPFAGVVLIIAALLVLTVIGATANFLHQYLAQTASTRAVADIRADAFAAVVAMPLSRVAERGPSEFVARIVRDAAALQNGLIALTSKSVAQVTKGVAAFVAALVFDWKLTVAACVIAPVLAAILRKLGTRVRRGTRGSLAAQEVLLRIATETLQGLRAVKANVAEGTAVERFAATNADVVTHELRVRTARALASPLVEALAVFALAGLALLAARGILDGRLELETFILALGALGVAGGSFRPLTGLVNEIQAAGAPAERLADILDEPPEPVGAGKPALPPHRSRIRFEGVVLRYPGAERAALDGVDLEIRRGEHVAIVGPNGSGKTTLVSLVPRLLVPTAGRVSIDDHDLEAVALESVRRQIGVVSQEVVMFRGSVADNVAFGWPADRAQVRAAARAAHAEEFIERLPRGYDTDLAEQGASLSGGQRQRLAIARAILRDPTILILDEATSQIDAESEAKISLALRAAFRGRTVLIVAHRLATVLDCDRIVVMDAGRVVAVGRHDELLETCPLYRRLVDTQLG